MYFLPMILSSHWFPCLLAAVREAIKANWLLQIIFWISIPATRRQKAQGSAETSRKNTPP